MPSLPAQDPPYHTPTLHIRRLGGRGHLCQTVEPECTRSCGPCRPTRLAADIHSRAAAHLHLRPRFGVRGCCVHVWMEWKNAKREAEARKQPDGRGEPDQENKTGLEAA